MEHLHPDDRERCWSSAGGSTTAAGKLSMEYRFLHPARGEGGSTTWPGSPARCHRPHGQVVWRPARHHADQASRGRVARPGPAPDPGPRGGARAARAGAARRPDAEARRARDRGRPRRARRAAERRRKCAVGSRGARAPERGRPLAGGQLHPSVLEELGLVEALRAESERRGRQGRHDLAMDLNPCRRSRQGRGPLPLPRGAGGAEQRARHAGTRAAR